MQRILSAAIACAFSIAATQSGRAVEGTWEYAVQVSASAQAAPAQIVLSWPQDTTTTPSSYIVYRKSPGATSWGTGTTLSGSATSYVDSKVSVGSTYEYQIVKNTSLYAGYGYVYAGINAPLTEDRGKLVLVVDNTYASYLATELNRLQQDLVGDGWQVIRIDVGRNDSVTSVKAQIKAQYDADPSKVKSVFLFGHVPVAYSGNIVPDGHTPDHQGAWPADAYYGDMDGTWTDNSVNISSASEARTRNVPGDGKFDQSNLPSDIELQVGRVDLANMPGRTYWGGPATFASELELLRNYLNKDHNFRYKILTATRRGLVADYFGVRSGEAFAASGWRNFSAFFGASNVANLNTKYNDAKGVWIPTLSANDFLWAYGCGAGSYTSIGGLGSTGQYNDGVTTELVAANPRAIFTMLFGSWLGDWDSEDNIQRAVLACKDYGLTCAWSGRPHWFLQHMALGETIGFGTRLTQNNRNGFYQNQINSCAGLIHVALMGDPTLRMHVVAPAANLIATTNSGNVTLTWSASPDSVAGYHVYRAANSAGPFTRLTSSLLTSTSYTDSSAASGNYTYMVRAVKLETTGGGSYYNPSQGIFAGATSSGGSAPTNLPAVSISSPLANATVSNSITIAATVSSVIGVQFKLDGAILGSEIMTSPFSIYWNTTSIGNGVHTLSAVGRDASGNTATATAVVVTVQNSTSSVTNPVSSSSDTVWIDDALPAGASGFADNDGWNWTGSNPAPFSGTVAHQSASVAGAHDHFFNFASATLAVSSGEKLFAYVYLDPANPPSELMLSWNTTVGDWEHRAYWGANKLASGTDGTVSRYRVGNLPVAGGWARLEVPASAVALEGKTLQGMGFALYGGRATWDSAGKSSASSGSATNPPIGTYSTNSTSTTNNIVWVEDALPSGASGIADGGDSWSWTGSSPAPFSGTLAHQSASASGAHSHYFNFAGTMLSISSGEKLFAYVYIDPAYPPSELMLCWNTTAGNWEHRAYWGANNIKSGKDGTAGRYRVGALPAAGGWTRLEVPASAVGLEGATLQGMSFGLYGGHATWDCAGKSSVTTITTITTNPPPSTDTTAPTISITSPSNNSSVSSTVNTTANASDNVGVAGVQFKLNGANLGAEVTSAPFSVNWDTASSGNGTYSLSAVARDAAGNRATASTISVVVNNVVSTNPIPVVTSNAASVVDYLNLELPKAGDHTLHVLAPNLLELKLINTKSADPARVSQWDLVDSGLNFIAPAISAFTVTVDGQPMIVTGVGFKRRPIYAPFATRDLRIENSLYLQLAAPISDGQTVEVKNPSGTLWPANTQFIATVDPLRYSPAIHVNQEGYLPAYQKKAMVGYYLGNLGEMNISASLGFQIVNAQTGAQVFQGTLTPRLDVGYTYLPTPYQKVLEADFTSYTTPGEYRLVVPGLGASLPFRINDGVAMAFTRTYALGLYHQRCGTNNAMPFTRFTHNECHTAAAAVPSPQSSFSYTWGKIAGYANTINPDSPTQTAPRLTSESAQLYPFVRTGTIDVSGGHHDAADYSKYTANSAQLIHDLMFAVDAFPGVAALDNLGLPESGDGISDVMQEAKWEADFLAKMQDADGGFYFLVYPQQREYENDVLPEQGDPQLVWPKTTSVTAASVAALAQCASSPKFKAAYPQTAALYLQKAQLGWQFLTNAINRYGKDGAYQKITHYSDDFGHDDELAWAACEMFLATGNSAYQQQLLAWFDPSSTSAMRWGWWRLYGSYGNAIRSYAFAVKSGRLAQNQLDATFFSKCQTQIIACGDDTMAWSQQNAYGTSFPTASKGVKAPGWYFSSAQAFDVTVAYQIIPKPEYLGALLANMNYEGGCNPVNVSYVTGLGWKRQREIVHQFAQNDRRILPPDGIPLGNIQASFDAYLWAYSPGELNALSFPSDNATTSPYPFYDRWADSYNVTAEFVNTDQARSLASLAFLSAQTSLKTQPWTSATGQINVTGSGTTSDPLVATLTAAAVDLTGARVVWEAQDQEPGFGNPFSFVPKNTGAQWIEAEAQLPDGRRIFATTSINATAATTVWIDDAVPNGAVAQSSGGDSWDWVSSPTYSGSLAHQSALASGLHEHFFDWAGTTLAVGAGDVLFAYVYLDPANPPTEVMLSWNDGSWQHRAYWGANSIGYGADGTASRHYMGALPTAGQWVRLEIPAGLVALEGSTVKGMSFSLFDGRATWDSAGRMTPPSANASAIISVAATSANASRVGPVPGVFTFTRSGNTNDALTVSYSLSGTAKTGADYSADLGTAPTTVTIPAGETSASLTLVPTVATNVALSRTAVLTIARASAYSLKTSSSATINIAGNTVPCALQSNGGRAAISWNSAIGKVYQVFSKNNLSAPTWTKLSPEISGTGTITSWTDDSSTKFDQRFYLVVLVR